MPTAEYFAPEDSGFSALIQEVKDTPELALDTETTGLINWKDLPLYWSLSWGNRRITMNSSTLHYFHEAFADANKTWIFANAKYDAHILANAGIHIAGRLACTQVMHSLLYEDSSHKLKDMAIHLLGWRWKDFQDTFGKISKKTGNTAESLIRRAERENFPLLVEYAANDAWGTWNLWLELKKQLEAAYTFSLWADCWPYINTLWDLFWQVEVPYTKVLFRNERNGIKMDRAKMEEIEPKVRGKMDELDREISREAGWIVNVDSPVHLQKLFYDKLGLEPIKMTKGGKSGIRKPSTDKHVRAYYAPDHPLVRKVDERIKLGTFYGTFLTKLLGLVDPLDRIHTSFNQDVARTGRLSSSNPNMQNIPTLERDIWRLREMFIAEYGNVIIAGDYSQLEMRLVAAASMEQDMIDVFLRGWDIHMGNASLMFDIPYDEIKEAKSIDGQVKRGELDGGAISDRVLECLNARAAAKNIGFGMNYGMGPRKLAGDLGISVPEAKQKIETYKETYPAIAKFYEEAIEETWRTGYAFTVLGRRRNLPEIQASSYELRSEAERKAVNTPIQGSAADVTKLAQILCDWNQLEDRFGVKQLLQIHDEIVFEGPADTAPQARSEIQELMEHSLPSDLSVPLTANIGIGPSWGMAH
jgi:DNA polymerase-1